MAVSGMDEDRDRWTWRARVIVIAASTMAQRAEGSTPLARVCGPHLSLRTALWWFGRAQVGNPLSQISFYMLPAALASAILRYRLYDTDRLINRTVVCAAAVALSNFNQRLRQQTDIDALSDDLVGVIKQAMMPSSVHPWLRTAEGSDG